MSSNVFLLVIVLTNGISASLTDSPSGGSTLTCYQCDDQQCRVNPSLSAPCAPEASHCFIVRRHDDAGNTLELVRGCGSGEHDTPRFFHNRCESTDNSQAYICYSYCIKSLCNGGPGGHFNRTHTFRYDSPSYDDLSPDLNEEPVHSPARHHQFDGIIQDGRAVEDTSSTPRVNLHGAVLAVVLVAAFHTLF